MLQPKDDLVKQIVVLNIDCIKIMWLLSNFGLAKQIIILNIDSIKTLVFQPIDVLIVVYDYLNQIGIFLNKSLNPLGEPTTYRFMKQLRKKLNFLFEKKMPYLDHFPRAGHDQRQGRLRGSK